MPLLLLTTELALARHMAARSPQAVAAWVALCSALHFTEPWNN